MKKLRKNFDHLPLTGSGLTTTPAAMKHRLERVREVIKRELSAIIARELTFDAQLVTVQAVDITPDLKQSHVFISAIGTPKQKDEAVVKLEENRPMLQAMLSRRVVLKNTPQLHFRLDSSIERGARIFEILEQIDIPKTDAE